ncbi:MAG: respiratory nitrate reductase subunit gamma, partial [Flavobacteriaceae bacterium]|nr:respiratory nitrate reductase subunit gamma [Flavobacteriaceae bacterium]
MNTLNNFFFIALPYIAFVVFLIGTISRYRSQKFKVSSLSSQFLEGKKLFWGSVP